MLEKMKEFALKQKHDKWRRLYKEEFRYLRNEEKRNSTPRGVRGIYPPGITVARVFNYEGEPNLLTKKGNAIKKMYGEVFNKIIK